MPWIPKPSTAPTRMTATIPPPPMTMTTWCVRCAFQHASGQSVILWVQPSGNPEARLRSLLADRAIFQHFPTEGWILTMELQCPFCGEVRLVEMIGPELYCACCGRAARGVTPATRPTPPLPCSGKPER